MMEVDDENAAELENHVRRRKKRGGRGRRTTMN